MNEKEIKQALSNVIDYLYADEQKNYEVSDEKEIHIFNDIQLLNNWLQEQ